MTASTITIVTKNTPQSYTGGTSAVAKGTALSVLEVDSNFINLKEGIIVLEAELASTDTSIRSYVNTNFIQSFSPSFQGVPTAPNPVGTAGLSQLQTVDGVDHLVSPIDAIVNSPTIGNTNLSNQLTNKANINSPQFTGIPQLTGTLYNFSNYDSNNNYIPKVEYVKDKLQNLSGDVKPASAAGADLGTSTEYFNELHVTSVLPAGSGATLGTTTSRFEYAYIEELHVGENTIFVGDAQISADGSTLVVPVNTAIGDQENVLPLNIASTTVDKRFAELSLVEPLDQSFTASGAITSRDPVALNSDGTVSTISGSVSNLNFIGIALASAADTASVSIRIHGEVSGFTGLTSGSPVFIENDGTLPQTRTDTSLKIGTAISTTEVMLFTTSNLDTYLLNIKKTELTDFSATTAGSPSGSGGLSYNNSTGVFTFTPADTSSFATISYVDTEVANLVNSAPATLDTLDELAAALNDDANFATTVTNSLTLKAPLADPALTGAPTAPTASSGTNTTQIATTAFVQTEISGLGNASLNSFSVTSNTASGGGTLSYNNTSGVFTYTPPDLSTFLTSYTETDPIVGAVNGIVKADGNGNISAAVAGTDYSTFDGAFSSLTGTPTTISGYGITDAAPLASPALTGTPTAPTATTGTNTTQIATTAFVQSSLTASGGIQLTDLSVTTGAASGGGGLGYNNTTGVFTFTPADTSSSTTLSSFSISTTSASGGGSLSYNNANGVFSFTPPDLTSYLTSYTETDPVVGAINGIVKADGAGNISAAVAGTDYSTFDGAFSSLTGTPTTVSGYGITDAAPLGSPAFTGTPTAPTATTGDSSTQLATTAFVQGEIAGFSTTGGDSQKSYTSSSAITEGDAVILDSAGTVSSVGLSAAAVGSVATFQSSTANQTSIGYDDYNSLYYYFFRSGSDIKVDIITPDFANLTTTTGSETTLVQSVSAGAIVKYVHLTGTSSGVLVYYTSTGYQLRIVSQSSGVWTVNTATTVNTGDIVRDITLGPSNTPLLLIEDSSGYIQVAALSISGTNITIGTYDQITGFTSVPSDIFYVQNKIVVADPYGSTVEYATGTISGTTISMNTALSVNTANSYNNIYYHGGSGLFVLDRGRGFGDTNPQVEIHIKPLSFNGTTLTALNDIATGWVSGRSLTSRHWQFSSSGTGLAIYAVYQTYQSYSLKHGLGTLTSAGTFTRNSGYTGFSSGTGTNPGAHESKDGYGMFLINGTKGTLVRLDSISNADSWLGVAESTVTSGNSVNVILAGGIADVYTGLTLNGDYYVQDDGSIASTATDVFAGVAVGSTALQITDTKNTFRKSTAFADLTSTPTTLSGYGISGDIDIGSSDFITTGKSYYANMFPTTGDLPSATTYHGMFAHVHGTGAGYFAHAGNWVELANKSYVDTEIANLVNSAPATLDTLDELAAALNDDANFATTITTSLGLKAPLADPALTGTPTAPTAAASTNTTQIATTAFVQQEIGGLTSYADSDVDTHLNTSTASSGEVLSWNGTDYDWVAQSGGGGGGASVTVSDAAPSNPSAGDLWFDSTGLVLYVYYNDGDSSQWVQTNPSGSSSGSSGGGASVSVSGTAPTSPSAGDLWFDDDDLFLYVYVSDGSSSQWVKTNPSGGGSSSTWAEKTAAYTAEAGDRLIVDTSTAVTVTLPATAALGDEIRIIDGTGTASTNNITVARNGHNIEGTAADLTIDVDRAAFGLVYYNATQGWVMMER